MNIIKPVGNSIPTGLNFITDYALELTIDLSSESTDVSLND